LKKKKTPKKKKFKDYKNMGKCPDKAKYKTCHRKSTERKECMELHKRKNAVNHSVSSH
jgi:hypothetical protein